jgi:acid stress-induced BolA-like protein IbaG/YrbA
MTMRCPTCGRAFRGSGLPYLIKGMLPGNYLDLTMIRNKLDGMKVIATRKQVYNALGYLVRRKEIKRLSYGVYTA